MPRMPMAGSNINIAPIGTPDAVLDCPDVTLDRTANRRGRPMFIERTVGGGGYLSGTEEVLGH